MSVKIGRRSLLIGTAAVAGAAALDSSETAHAATGDSALPLNGDWRYTVSHYAIGNTVMTYRSSSARLYGATTMTAKANTPLTSLYVDFALSTASAFINGKPVNVTRPKTKQGWRQLQLSGFSLPAGAAFEMTLHYDDYPEARNQTTYHNGVINSGAYVTFSGEPDCSIYWYPSNDRLNDKATYDISISTQATNQILGYRTSSSYYHWTPKGGVPMINTHLVINEPSSTYHPGLSVGPYSVGQGTWNVAGVKVPYTVAGPGCIPTAITSVTPKALDMFATLYGPYPYSVAGGFATVDLPVGAQENVGCCSYKLSLVSSTARYATAFVAHENAHMWFGNSVTASDWNDVILLQEGLAVLLEHDYISRFGGASEYSASTVPGNANFGPSYLAATGPYNSAYYVHQELRRAMDGSIVQQNAPRHTAFLRDWATTYRHSNVNRAQFKAMAEKHAGRSLASFWSQHKV